MSATTDFGNALKAWLRAKDAKCELRIAAITAHDTEGYGFAKVDWPELDRAIDEFCAEMKAKQDTERAQKGTG